MLRRGAASKLVIYVNEREKYQGRPLFESVVQFLQQHGCAGATVTKAIAGYGSSGKMHEAHLFHLSEDVPVRIEAIDSEQKISALLPFLYDMVRSGLIEVQETEVIKHAAHEAEEEQQLKHEKLEGQAKMLRIYIGEDDRWEGEPLHEAIVKKLRMLDVAGATVYRGVMGYGAQQRLHKKSGWLSLSTDLPIMVSVIDTEEKIRRVLPVLDEMVDEGLVVMSDVEIIKYTHSHKTEQADEEARR